LPEPISRAASFICASGPVILRARKAAAPRMIASAASPVIPMTAMICRRRESSIEAGIAVRTAPMTVPSCSTGSAAYRMSSRTVMLRRWENPGTPDSASRISGWLSWFSIEATPSAPTVESATTVPSGRTTVRRVPEIFPMTSPSRAIPIRSSGRASSRGRNVSATSVALMKRVSSASFRTRPRTLKKPTPPAIRSAIPPTARWVRKNLEAMERRPAMVPHASRSL